MTHAQRELRRARLFLQIQAIREHLALLGQLAATRSPAEADQLRKDLERNRLRRERLASQVA